MFPPAGLPSSEEFILITDQLASPADFLLHRLLASQLKQSKDSKCLILSLSESFTRWKVLAGKANINLTQHISSGSVVFKDSQNLPEPPAPSGAVKATLRPLFDSLRHALDTWNHESSRIMVIVDDISVLEWMGFTAEDISRFVRALYAACRKVSASLIIRYHTTTPGDLEDLSRPLLQLSTYHIEVLPLSSGRSGEVSGEVALHLGPQAYNPVHKPIPRSSAIQYRLTDTSCIFFERGTGSSVL